MLSTFIKNNPNPISAPNIALIITAVIIAALSNAILPAGSERTTSARPFSSSPRVCRTISSMFIIAAVMNIQSIIAFEYIAPAV
jgi:hypothetical protein